MAKNIVICLDGTGNQFKEDNSNVVKLYRVITRDVNQLAYYDPGVGTLADPNYKTPLTRNINKALGLAFGRGMTRNVEQAYSYLMENYQAGDKVFIFGFSRGAYTARVLSGLIHSCGLLESGCQNLIPYAMKLYKAKRVNFGILRKFRSTYGRSVDIHFLGLWDSVSTCGWIYNPVFLPFTTNNESVKAVRHALAIDERRSFFKDMPWGDKFRQEQDIKEVWFPGVHSDIGGGYPEAESGLAKITLEWMLNEARQKQFGLIVDDKRFDRYVLGKGTDTYVGPDPAADRHESLQGPWKLVQWIPRSMWNKDKGCEEIRKPPLFRNIAAGQTLHRSVLERMKARDYQPESLKGRSIEELRESFKFEPAEAVETQNLHRLSS